MNAQLATAEIHTMREMLHDYPPGVRALDELERHKGNIPTAFEDLWVERNGAVALPEKKSLWQTTLKVLRNELCGDDGFRAQVKEYSTNPASTPLLTGLIVYLVGISGLPIDPAIATVVVLYILKIGLNIFCEYTEIS